MWERLFFALWMGFLAIAYGFVSVLFLSKALQGEIRPIEAAWAIGPLLLSYLGVWVGGGSFVSWICGFAGLGFLCWITYRRHEEERRAEQEVIDRDLVKWGRAVHDDESNAGAHLFLGNALAQRGKFDDAVDHYRRSLELDPRNARDLMRFLGQQGEHLTAEIRSRLPELERIVQEQRERDTYGRVVTGPNAVPPPAPAPLAPEEAEPEPEPAAPEMPHETPPEREFFGYASEEERYDDQVRNTRLSELRQVLDTAPDDVVTRYAYAAVLEEAGHAGRARAEYQQILALAPGHADAATAVARLDAAGVVAEREEEPGSPARKRLEQLSRLKEVLSGGEEDVAARLAYARSLEAGGRPEDARAQYERVLAQEPYNEDAKRALARLGAPPAPEPAPDLSVESFAPPPNPPRERA